MTFSLRTLRSAAVAAAVLLPSLSNAQGMLQYISPLAGTGNGLGAVLTTLTLNNSNDVSTGCVTPSGAGTVATCGYANNSVQNQSQVQFLNAIGGNFGTLGTDLRIVANFSEPQNTAGQAATVDNLSLILYGPTGTPLYTASLKPSASVTFAQTNPGVGNIGFGFGLTGAGATAFQTILNSALQTGGTGANLSIGLGASLMDVQGGLDTFSLTRVNVATVVPEPSTYALMAMGLAGIVLMRRKRFV